MNLNEHLAIKVMGWEHFSTEGKKASLPSYFNNEGWLMFVESWNPSENGSQSQMCLDTFEWWRIDRSSERYYVSIYQDKGIDVKNKSLPMAISLACAKATGWVE